MIEMTLKTLINSVESLQKLSNKNLKAKTAFVVAKLIQAADIEVNNFNDARIMLINKYGEKDDNGNLIADANNNVKIIKDDIERFNTELSELLNTPITINATKITLNELDELEFTPQDIIQLEPFIEIE